MRLQNTENMANFATPLTFNMQKDFSFRDFTLYQLGVNP